MAHERPATAILHYAAPPLAGGVEAVILAHARAFLDAGYPVTIVAGQGDADALPAGVAFISIPEMSSRHPALTDIGAALERGETPPELGEWTARLRQLLAPVLRRFDAVIVHNVLTKHFNLPLTAALHDLLDRRLIRRCIAWCHDISWTSPRSRSKVHPGYPWDLLRTHRPDVTYVAVSRARQHELAGLFQCEPERIRVIYNGVDPEVLLGLSAEGRVLVRRLNLLDGDLVLIMPVRATQAKNIEYALHVVAALKARGCRPQLVVTGPPDPHTAGSMRYYRSLQALRRELDVEGEARFVFESGHYPDQPFLIDERVVSDLLRASDVMFMPSHREGFGMPVLEAGMLGLPVVCTDVPAAQEIAGDDVVRFAADEDPEQLAGRLLDWAEHSQVHRWRRRVRQDYSWTAIFRRDIEPLLKPGGVTE